MTKQDFNFIVKELHHAGKPHASDKLRIQLNSNNIIRHLQNFAIGFTLKNNLLFAFSIKINAEIRGFNSNSSININDNIFNKFDTDNFISFGYTKFNEPVVYGFSIYVLDYLEKTYKLNIIDQIPSNITFASFIFHYKFPYQLVGTPIINLKQLKNEYYIYSSTFNKLILSKIKDELILLGLQNDQKMEIKKVLNFNDLIELFEVINSPLIDNKSINIRYNYLNEKFEICPTSKRGILLPKNLAIDFLNNIPVNTNDFAYDLEVISKLKLMENDGYLEFSNDQYKTKEIYSICFDILLQYWKQNNCQLIIKEDLIYHLKNTLHLAEDEAVKVANYPGILKRRLCILGKPFLYYHIKSDIYDISRDYNSISDFIRFQISEKKGNLYSIYQEIENMIHLANPEIITKTIYRLQQNNELTWQLDKVIGCGFFQDLDNNTLINCNLILEEISKGLLDKNETSIIINSQNLYNIAFILSFLDKMANSDFVKYEIDSNSIIIKINCNSEKFKLDDSLLFLPFSLTHFFANTKRRRKLIFETTKFQITYIPKYNTLKYESVS
jgi:hypothetical protein